MHDALAIEREGGGVAGASAAAAAQSFELMSRLARFIRKSLGLDTTHSTALLI